MANDNKTGPEAKQYYSFVKKANLVDDFTRYEHGYKELARHLVPWNEFIDHYEHLDNDLKRQVGHQMDYCLIRMLEWFKCDFFSWVDSLHCDECNRQCSFVECRPAFFSKTVQPGFNCSNVEMYKCNTCGKLYEFARYNHAGKLLITRRGRCGEWAIAFAYLCFVFSYDVRLVYHFLDHVWVEVYSEFHQRWIHCDPCENAYDNPLMYECGWNKQSTLIIAYGLNHIRDVTWRYSSKWQNTVQIRQQLFDEVQLMFLINGINGILQRNLTHQQRYNMEKRWLAELTEFIRLPDQVIQPEPKALQARLSGSIEWRKSRAEAGFNISQSQYIFQCTSQTSNRTIRVLYDCHLDNYLFVNPGRDEQVIIDKWNTATFQFENIERIVENDWKMCYLSRQRYSTHESIGIICWRFKISHNCKSIGVRLNGKTFDSGQIDLQFKFDGKTKQINLNEAFQMDMKNRIETDCQPYFDIEAKLKFGNGSLAWQHAQLFRQSIKSKQASKNREDMLEINIIY